MHGGQQPATSKDLWKRNGEIASKRGTLMHWHVEMFLNGAVMLGPMSPEFNHFLNYFREVMSVKGLEAYRTELSVFHTGLKCAGQVDLLARYKGTDRYAIVDWKRSKEIKSENPFQQLASPLGHLPDANFYLYSLQVNVYRYFLQSEYDIRIDDLYLVILHPDNDNYVVIEAPIMDTEMNALVEFERVKHGAGDPMAGAWAPFNRFELHSLPCIGEEDVPPASTDKDVGVAISEGTKPFVFEAMAPPSVKPKPIGTPTLKGYRTERNPE
jgi:hypothetical protein